MPDHWKEASPKTIRKEYLDITQHEIEALKVDYNLADAHTHQSQSSTQKEIVASLPDIWYESERNKQYDMEQRFIEAFFRVQRRPKALETNNVLLVYAASIAMVITANYLRKMGMSVSLIEPCFDNIHDILKHMGVPMQPLKEELLADEDAIIENLQASVASDAIFIVDPNNPTGFTLLGGRRRAFCELVRFAKDTNKLLILDFCFAAFISRGPGFDAFDPYEILEESGVSYIVIEDTGKTWPIQDAKAALIKCSQDVYRDIYNIHTSYLLNVSPFILNLVTRYVLDSEKDNFASVHDLLDRNREIAKRVLAGSLLEYQEPRVNVSVAWFKIRDPAITASELQDVIRAEGAYVLPGTYFFWSDHARGERYIRVALARDTGLFEPAIKVVRAAVDRYGIAS